jgi:hypothetical protein
MRLHAAVSTLLIAGLGTGCATGATSRADVRRTIDIQYGRVDEVEQVQIESGAGKAAIVGGVIGALTSRRHLLGAAVGAGAAGVTTAAVEGPHQGFAYTVRMDGGRMIKVVVDHGDVAVGQCVAVEQGGTPNVRAVSPEHCPAGVRAPGVPAAPPAANAEIQRQAAACQEIHDAVLAAKSAEELDLLEKKARIVCGR